MMKLKEKLSSYIVLVLALFPLIFQACGDPKINMAEQSYDPKISVEAYIFAGEPVRNIKIRRNYALGIPVDLSRLALTPADNAVVVELNGIALMFDETTLTYYNNSIVIENGRTYKLTIHAVIDGKALYAESVTTVPQSGFGLLNPGDLGEIRYQQDQIEYRYNTSPDASLYVFSFIAKQADQFSYIYDNPYESRQDTADVIKNLADYQTQYDIVGDINGLTGSVFSFQPDFYNLRFYGPYKSVVYAGDKNFKDFLYSANDVEEPDGNFHEPVSLFKGDGIGVFASAIKDTVIFTLVK